MKIVGITGQAGSGKDTVADHLCEKHRFRKIALADPIKRFGLHVFEFDEIQLWGPSSARNAFDPRYMQCDIRSHGAKFEPGCSIAGVKRVTDRGWGMAAENLLEYGPHWLQDVLPDCDVDAQMKTLCFWFASLGHKYPELSPRIMLQHLGTEWGRHVADEDIWIDMFIRESKIVLAGNPYSREDGAAIKMDGVNPPAGIVCSDVRFANELRVIKDAGGRTVRVVRPETDADASTTGIKQHASEAEQKSFTADMFGAIITNDGTLKDLYQAVDTVITGFGY